MLLKIICTTSFLLLALAINSYSLLAHSVGTNRDGCHYVQKGINNGCHYVQKGINTGYYHCHSSELKF